MLDDLIVKNIITIAKNKNLTLTFLDNFPQMFGVAMSVVCKKKKIIFFKFLDLDINHAISQSDLCIIGVDAVTKKGSAIVKTGTKTALKLAEENHTKTYLITNSWRIDTKNQHTELVNYNTKTHTKYEEIIKPTHTYITEQGIFDYKHIVQEAKFFNKNLI